MVCAPSCIVLRSFLSELPPERAERLLAFFPETMRKEMEKIPSFKSEKGFESPLDLIHWSWFIPTLKTYPLREQELFLSSLSSSAAKNLSQELGLDAAKKEISQLAASFLRQVLLQSLTGVKDSLLPIEYLPPSPLKALLFLSKKELTHLIDLLSLYDLAAELRQIVETKILKRLYSFLSEEQRKFLKIAMVHKDPFPIPRLGLDKWEGNEEAFAHLLHRRGLARLGAALSGQHPDLIWYLCHQLDIGRGNALFKLSTKEAIAGVSEVVIRQIEDLLAMGLR